MYSPDKIETEEIWPVQLWVRLSLFQGEKTSSSLVRATN